VLGGIFLIWRGMMEPLPAVGATPAATAPPVDKPADKPA
jgi:hypothetical protein